MQENNMAEGQIKNCRLFVQEGIRKAWFSRFHQNSRIGIEEQTLAMQPGNSVPEQSTKKLELLNPVASKRATFSIYKESFRFQE
jgi:hypothetical protein